MSSTFTTPLGDVTLSNGGAELLEQACAAIVREQARLVEDVVHRDAAERVANFLDETAECSGAGCYGFDVRDEPLDDALARRVFLDALGALAERIRTRSEPFTFLDRENLQSYWLDAVSSLYAGVAATLLNTPPLDLLVPSPLAASIKARRLAGEWMSLKAFRVHGRPGADVARERDTARQLLAAMDEAGESYSPHLLGDERAAARAMCEELEVGLANSR